MWHSSKRFRRNGYEFASGVSGAGRFCKTILFQKATKHFVLPASTVQCRERSVRRYAPDPFPEILIIDEIFKGIVLAKLRKAGSGQ